MKRPTILTALLVAGILSISITAAQQQTGQRGAAPFGGTPSVDAIMVEKVTENLFVLRGGGGNTAAFIVANGVVLVDSKLTGWGQPIIEKLRTITNKPVTTIINTHAHFDHVNGNVEFPANVEIVTHENTKTLMQEWNPVYGLTIEQSGSPFKASGGRGLPTRTFRDRLTLGRGADQVDIYYYGRAHTSGDAWVVFPAARVMHAGDAFPNKSVPIMDKNNGGSGLAYADTLAKAGQTPGVDRVITGHSAVMTIDDLREYSQYIREWVSAVQAAKKAGRTIDDIVNTWKVPEKFKGYTQPQAASLRSNAEVIWEETK